MVTLRKFLVCIAAGWATLGMSHWALAHESGENEAAEREDAHNESSEHNDSRKETTERSGSRSGTASTQSTDSSSSASNDTTSSSDSRSSSRSSVSNGTSARASATRRVTGSSSSTASRTTRSRDGGTERRVNLRTFVGGRGKAESKASGIRRTFEVELENTTLQPGQSLSVSVNGVSVGSMTVGLSGRRTKAKLKLDTQLGSMVPAITTGSAITIMLGTATVASGTF